MKIAVCLSGQPRTIKYTVDNIKKFFSNHDTDYFCHAWDYNTYKRKKIGSDSANHIWWEPDTPVDLNEFHTAMNVLSPKKVVVEKKEDLPLFAEWSSLFYSMMMANHYKKVFERDNNFRYDFVFRATYQGIYWPERQFDPTGLPNKDNYLDIYGIFRNRMYQEFNRINISDHCFYGSSTAMDVFCDFYKYFYPRYNEIRGDDRAILGPGTMLSEQCCERYNLDFHGGMVITTNYRKEMIPKDGIVDYQEIQSHCYN